MTFAWQPTATLDQLRRRASILEKIRAFFKSRQVLEVETALLSEHTVTDPHLESFYTYYQSSSGKAQKKLYLQTSPEFAMKRLLAAGSGPIYQITHAFRNRGEQGRWHNPEFTLLEWYRPNFALSDLMDEVDDLLGSLLDCQSAYRVAYGQLFQDHLAINPHQISLTQVHNTLEQCQIRLQSIHTIQTIEDGLSLLLDYIIQSHIDIDRPLFIYDFPVSQAASAQIRAGNPPVTERVEVYLGGLELANGFHELLDPIEQSERFHQDLNIRQAAHLSSVPIDRHLVAALQHGLPDCSGIALGIDRLVAYVTRANSLTEVIAFPIDRA